MKKYISVLALFLAIILVQPVHAQAVDTTTDNPTIIALLEQIIALLEQELSLTQSLPQGDTPPIVVTPQVATASAPTIPSCENSGHGSVNAWNCIVVSPTSVQGGTTTTFTITAPPMTFQPLDTGQYSLSSDNTTVTYTTYVGTSSDFAIYLPSLILVDTIGHIHRNTGSAIAWVKVTQ